MPNKFFIISLFSWVFFLNYINLEQLSAKTLVIDGIGTHEQNISEQQEHDNKVHKKNIISKAEENEALHSRILIPEQFNLLNDPNLFEIAVEEEVSVFDEDSFLYDMETDEKISKDSFLEDENNSDDSIEIITNQTNVPIESDASIDSSIGLPKDENEDIAAITNNTSSPTEELNELDIKSLRIYFEEGSAIISDTDSNKIINFASNISKEIYQISINAYAVQKGDKTSVARRLSLSRALAVRKIFIKSGISSESMQIRALGNNFEGESGDRVEINLIEN